MDPRDVATMALIAGPALVLGSSLAALAVVRLVQRRRGYFRGRCGMIDRTCPERKD
jgi:hypothetical protein